MTHRVIIAGWKGRSCLYFRLGLIGERPRITPVLVAVSLARPPASPRR